MASRASLKLAVFAAAKSGDLESLNAHLDSNQDLIDARDHRSDSLLHEAAAFGQLEVMALLVERGMNVSEQRVFLGGDAFVYTPLHAAARANQIAAVNWLIDRGSDIEAASPQSGTPLLVAAMSGHLRMVQNLLDKGANLDAFYEIEEVDGRMQRMDAILLAQLRGHSEVVTFLETFK